MSHELETFYNHYVRELQQGNAAVFAGAGLSVPAGFVDWKTLLRDIARDLELDVNAETDLVALAQYHVNAFDDRSPLNQLLIEEFTRSVTLTENHRLIAQLPLPTVWTTNYDELLENAFEAAGKQVDVKRNVESLATNRPRIHTTVYKMHGDITAPHDAVLTKDDYETYNDRRQLFTIQLQGHLVSKTFLFLGFSFSDPNIDYILSRIRVLLGKNKKVQYCILRRIPRPANATAEEEAAYKYQLRRQQHRIEDLKRYSIRALMIDQYSEVTDILRELVRRSRLKDVFVSGSAHSYEPLGKTRLDDLARVIGQNIIRRGYNLISGLGLGLGSSVLVGAWEALYERPEGDTGNRMTLRAFPPNPPEGFTKEAFRTRYRTDLVRRAGFAIFVAGNWVSPTGETLPGQGVIEEFEITRKQGVYPIPVGASGLAARQIWETVMRSVETFFPRGNVRPHLEMLGSSSATNEQLVEAIFQIIRTVET